MSMVPPYSLSGRGLGPITRPQCNTYCNLKPVYFSSKLSRKLHRKLQTKLKILLKILNMILIKLLVCLLIFFFEL